MTTKMISYITTFYTVGPFWIYFFNIFVACIFWIFKKKIGILLWFVFDNIRGLSFHFYLYNVRKENTFHLKILKNLSLFFVYYNFVVKFQMHVEIYHQW